MENLTNDFEQRPADGQSDRSKVDYRILFESSNDGIFVVRDGVVVDANKRALAMFACELNELLGKSIKEISPEYQLDGALSSDLLNEATEIVMSGGPFRGQWLYLRPNGSKFLAEITLSLLSSSRGNMVIAALRDITKEQKMAELFENIYRINPVAMMLTDVETGVHIDINESYTKIFGFTPEEAIGKTTLDLGIWIAPDERLRFIDLSAHQGRVTGFETQMRNKKRERIDVLLNSIVLRHDFRKVLLTMAQDISKLRQVEISLRTIFEESPFGLIVTEPKTGRIINVNHSCLEIMGYPRDEVIGKRGGDVYNLSKTTRVRLESLLERNRRFDNEEILLVTKNGERLTLLISGRIISLNESPAALIALQDITNQKQAEQALRESEEKYSKLFSANPDFISVSDIETGLFLEANEGLKNLLGYSRKEMIGKTSVELGMWVDVEERAKFIAEVKKKGELLGFPIKFRGRTGNIIDATISSKAIDFGGRKCMLNVIKDVSDKVKLEEQLRHSQRMESIGTLAGGVAHDFNNILTGIEGHVELARMKLGDENPAASNLDMVMNLADKAAQLNHSLLAFSRKQTLNREMVRIREIIQNSEKFLKRLIGADIDFSVILKDDATVNADALQIEQVIANIVVNARDAMPKGGGLTIATDIVDVDEFTAKLHQLDKTGPYVCITIGDTGVGMTKEVLDQIFDPFFTTKGVGKGTGLGLAMAYGNIRQHGGFISVYSEVGIGTQFSIYLPVVHGATVRKTTEEGVVSGGGAEIILIAEDDEVVRDLNRRFLERSGYTVLDAADGEEAIRIFNANMEKISMVILDVVMPKKNGKEVFDAIKLVRPSMKILFISGYTDDYIRERAELGNNVELMLKPVAPRLLLQKVRETLDR
jgi:PAS domain S-box-containing protein